MTRCFATILGEWQARPGDPRPFFVPEDSRLSHRIGLPWRAESCLIMLISGVKDKSEKAAMIAEDLRQEGHQCFAVKKKS